MRALELRIPPVAQGALVALLMWLLDRWLPLSLPGISLPRWFIVLLALGGAAVALAGVYEFWREKTTVDPRVPGRAAALVTGGVYRITRNPMYLGILLVLLAWGLYLGSVAALLPMPVFVLAMNRLQILPEERHMQARFAAEYAAYRSRVRRWI